MAAKSKKSKLYREIDGAMLQQLLILVGIEKHDLEITAARFQVDPEEVRKHIEGLRDHMQSAITERVAELAAEQELKRLEARRNIAFDELEIAQKLRQTREDSYKNFEVLQRAGMAVITKAVHDAGGVVSPGIIAACEKDMKAINKMAETLRLCTHGRLLALGVRDYEYEAQTDLPILTVEKLTPDQVDTMREQQRLEAETFDLVETQPTFDDSADPNDDGDIAS
jgi:hypothetical protein